MKVGMDMGLVLPAPVWSIFGDETWTLWVFSEEFLHILAVQDPLRNLRVKGLRVSPWALCFLWVFINLRQHCWSFSVCSGTGEYFLFFQGKGAEPVDTARGQAFQKVIEQVFQKRAVNIPNFGSVMIFPGVYPGMEKVSQGHSLSQQTGMSSPSSL